MRPVLVRGAVYAALVFSGGLWTHQAPSAAGRQAAGQATESQHRELLRQYCTPCHNERLKTAGLTLDALDVTRVAEASAVWEKVVVKLRGGMMPPVGRPRPDRDTIHAFAVYLERELDRAAAAEPQPGRVPVHRLNRAEYTNAIRDLLALEIDAAALLPADDVGHGFDNIAGSLSLSPALLERYMSAARRISRLAVGDPSIGPGYTSKVYSVPINMTQNDRMSEDLPFGSRAGLSVRHHFPLDGEYHLRITLKKSVYEYIVNLDEAHDLDIRLDGARVQRVRVGGVRAGKPAPLSFSGTFMAASGLGFPTQEWDDYRTSADKDLAFTVTVRAGTHAVGVSFVGKSWEPEGVLQPPLREYSATVTETTDTSSGPEGPGIESLAIDGPYQANGPGDTPSRRRIFTCGAPRADEERCARQILSALARRAFRRPVREADISPLIGFYREGRQARGFEGGIESALERLLVDPEFIFRIEPEPERVSKGGVSPVSDLALAARLSFFLWSSIPDEELLGLAERGRLRDETVLERQVRRMLADERSRALVQNFFAQWLQTRGVHGQAPDPNLFPEFDENLRTSFAREIELFLEAQLRDDRPVPELLAADYSFLNERLARHYEIPNVEGSRFRRVALPDGRRGGLLGMGGVLMVTSYGNRTSPVLRAKWMLENLLGTPPPPPPGDVPPFPPEAGENGEPRSVRERLAQHRKNPVCANCHAPMDPLGFALENFDAVGKWRTLDANAPIDASGVLVDGTSFTGPAELRHALIDRRDQVVRTVVERLLTYATGRGLEASDAPVVRGIARAAAARDYKWSSVILEVVRSAPFRMRTQAAAPGQIRAAAPEPSAR